MSLPLTDTQRLLVPQHLEILARWTFRPEVIPQVVRSWDDAAWDLFTLLAHWQGVLALLAALPLCDRLPPAVQQVVRTGHALNRRRNERLLDEMATLLAALTRAGVPAMPLKGSVLLENNLYGDVALRSLRDLDLLVPEDHLEDAVAVMGHTGYRVANRTGRHVILEPRAGGGVVSWRYDHPDNPRRVDLHSTVGEDFRGVRYDLTARLWREAREREFLGSRVPVPSLAGLLHHAAVHTSGNILERTVRLIHLVDLATLAHALPASTLQAALSPATDEEARFLYPSLRLTAAYMGPGPLDTVSAGVAERVHPALRAWADGGRLSNRTFVTREARPIGETYRFWPRTRRERIGVLRHTLFHSRHELASLYPRLAASPFFWLCYPRFWASLLRSWSKRSRGWFNAGRAVDGP